MAHGTTAATVLVIATVFRHVTSEILLENMTALNETITDTYINTTSFKFVTNETAESENTSDTQNVTNSKIFTPNSDQIGASFYKDNETLGIQVVQWGGWSNWFCSVPCGATGFFVRTRNCNWENETSGMCVGKAFEETSVCNVSHIKCPFECSNDSWGVGCDNFCSFNCRGRRCDRTTGACISCRDYYFGDYCEFRCFKGRYGKKCENSCGHLCLNGCNLKTGSCAGDITIFVAVVAMITIICYLPTILAYFNYSRTFGLTSPLTTVATVDRRKS